MIHCLVGVSNSGKSTFAKNMVRYMENAVVINRDSLREMIFGYTPENVFQYHQSPNLKENEKLISVYQDALIKQALADDKDIILDNTHLRQQYINELKRYEVPIRFTLMEVDFETALERDGLRSRSVGERVLRKQFEELEHLKKNFDFKPWEPTPIVKLGDSHVPEAWNVFIFDLDGTLALNNGKRSPYEWKRVGEDSVNDPVRRVLWSLSERGYKIIICSGRDEVCRPETEAWLQDNEIGYRELLMRPKGDPRKDSVVKEEFWRDLTQRYNIKGMFDDRKQVIDHARKHGFTVFDVAGHTF